MVQRKIDQLYYDATEWPAANPKIKPSFDKAVPIRITKAKVKKYLQQSAALEQQWGRPITSDQLQAEMDRFASETKDAEFLTKLLDALDNDPFIIAECLARPLLADRMTRDWQSADQQIQKAPLQQAQQFKTAAQIQSHPFGFSSIHIKGDSPDFKLVAGSGSRESAQMREFPDSYVVTRTLKVDKQAADVLVARVEKVKYDDWLSHFTPNPAVALPAIYSPIHARPENHRSASSSTLKPDSWQRLEFSPFYETRGAVWTGRYAIVYGDRVNGGESIIYPEHAATRYDPVTDTWSPLALPPNIGDLVWTGSELLGYGDKLGPDGWLLPTIYRYDLSTDAWSTADPPGLPFLYYAQQIWTGNRLIVFGTDSMDAPSNLVGLVFDPGANSFQTIPAADATVENRTSFSLVWTGSEAILFGGFTGNPGPTNHGARYNPFTNTWSAITTIAAPSPRHEHVAVWTGSRMIVFSGNGGTNSNPVALNDGASYDPDTDAWFPISSTNAPAPRIAASACWTGNRMVVIGGIDDQLDSQTFGDGGVYNPNTNTWAPATPLSLVPKWNGSQPFVSTWTGSEFFLWGAPEGQGAGGRYNPVTNSWIPVFDANTPIGRDHFSSNWTGDSLIVFGGEGGIVGTISGGAKYDPATNQWTPISSNNAPPARYHHTGTWAGAGLWIWGGRSTNDEPLGDGGVYNPATDSWSSISADGPSPRYGHSAGLWNGKLVIWAGTGDSGSLSDGGIWTPSVGWHKILSDGAPDARTDHASVIAGNSLFVWGGAAGSFRPHPVNTGGLYDLISGTWTATSMEGVPLESVSPRAFLNDGKVIVTGGEFTSEGGIFDLGSLTWERKITDPIWRDDNSAVFTGKDVIIWGGNHYPDFDPVVAAPTGSIYDPEQDVWRLANAQNQPAGRIQHQCVWAGDRMICWDGSADDSTGGIYFPNTPPRAIPIVSTTSNLDDSFLLGSGELLNLDGALSTDGSNAQNSTPYHDTYDQITSYEWDLNGDAHFDSDCQSSSSGVDRTGVTITLSESNLAQIGLSQLGVHTVWLRVTDSVGSRSCQSGSLILVDGQAPAVHVANPNGGDSWTYSSDPNNRQQHLIVWNSSDNFSVASTEVSYTTDGSTWTCIADSSGQDCPANGLPGAATYYLWSMPTQAEAAVTGQTLPSATARIMVRVWDNSNNVASDASDSNFYLILPATSSVRTLILWNSARIEGFYPGESTGLGLKLQELADHAKVSGIVLDLASVPEVQTAFGSWDASPTNQTLANAAAAATKTYLDSQLSTYTDTEDLILVGNDGQLPYFRMVDGTTIYPENVYPSEVGLDTTTGLGSAIAQGFFLTDNYYSEMSPETSGMTAPHDRVYQNDLFTGRLVETPAQIEGVINAFLAQNGEVNISAALSKVLVSGSDFLYDSALDIRNEYAASKLTDCLLDDPDSPGNSACVDQPYTSTDLLAQLAGGHLLNSINTHANHFTFNASTGFLDTTTMDAGISSMAGEVLYTSGCHSGLSAPPIGSNTLDLPELMAKKGVVGFIGNTGYGWGLRYGVGLTERLMQLLTDQFTQNASISVGKAIGVAKRRYYLEERRYDVFDEKVLHELSLYGIPNYVIITQSGGAAPAKEAAGLSVTGSDSSCANGICITKTGTKAAAGPVTTVDLNFAFSPQTYSLVSKSDGQYFTLNGLASGEVGEPIQPHFIYDSQLSGTSARGTLFTGGHYDRITEASPGIPFNPLIAVPRSTNVDNGEGPIPGRRVIVPDIRVSNGGSFAAKAPSLANQAGYTNLVVDTGYYDGAAEIRFKDMQFISYYSTSPDVQPPSIVDPGPGGFHSVSGSHCSFSVQASDEAGILRVLVVFNDTTSWQNMDLVFNSSTQRWEGALNIIGPIAYYVAAVDTNGNIEIPSVSGQDVDGSGQPYGSTWSGPRIYDASPSFLLYDDFSDGDASDWTTTGPTWTVVGGQLQGTTSKLTGITAPFTGCLNCTIEMDVTPTAHAQIQIYGWNFDHRNFVSLILSETNDTMLLKQKLAGTVIVKSKIHQPIIPGTKYHVTISYDGVAFHVLMDAVQLINLATPRAPLAGGLAVKVKSESGASLSAQFDSFVIY